MIPIEIGITSYRVQHFNEKSNQKAFCKDSGLVRTIKRKGEIKTAANKREIE